MKHKIITFIFVMILIFPIRINASEKIKVTLDRCVDGDTAVFKVKKESKKARFLGVNTPESVKENSPVEPYGKQASNYTCNKLKKAKKIEIEYDPKSNKEDNYGRLLVWVFVDDKLLQKDLVRLGYAEVKYVYNDYLYVDELKKEEQKAKDKKLRIWSEEAILEKQIIKENPNKNVDKIDLVVQKISNFLNKIIRKVVKRVKSMI